METDFFSNVCFMSLGINVSGVFFVCINVVTFSWIWLLVNLILMLPDVITLDSNVPETLLA